MREYPAHEDLGLNPEADRTEDLRPGKHDDPGAGTPRPSEHTTQQETEKGTSMTDVNECPSCTVPTEGDTCGFCKTYVPPNDTAGPHKIVTVDAATPWREFVDELTDYQRKLMEDTEQRYRELGMDPDDPNIRREFLGYVLDYINGNRIDADYAHVPVPTGAEADVVAGWERDLGGDSISYSRSLTWRDFETGHEAVGLDISGRQSTDGSFTRRIQLYGDGAQLDADEARRLAAALTEAATELDRLAAQ